jgi:predicted  nucleic acid-binding Zn-ribbon protein
MKPVSPFIAETVAYREVQGEIQEIQSDLSATGAKIETEAQSIIQGLSDLENAMTDAPPEEAARWIHQVQSIREDAENLQGEVNTLNLILSQERGAYNNLFLKFNDYEAAQKKIVLEMDTELTSLRVENRAVKGQRNTILAAVITAVSVILIIIAVKVLRRARL